jgi:LPS-assembly protein
MKLFCLQPSQPAPMTHLSACYNLASSNGKALVSILALFCSSVLWAQQYSPIELDWQATAPILTNYCNGYYKSPVIISKDPNLPAEQQSTHYLADTIESQQGIMTLQGNVEIQQGQRVIYSNQAIIDTNADTIDLQAKVRYREPDLLLRGEQAMFDSAEQTTVLDNAQMVKHSLHMRGQARQITHRKDGSLVLDQGMFTYCEPGNNAWTIQGSSIEIDPEQGFGQAYNAHLKLGLVPVLYLPWMSFPVNDKRRSGFLYPKMNFNSSGAIHLIAPYYLDLAPNYDATITPHKTWARGILLSALGRYLNQTGSQSIELAWTPRDRITQQQRWLLDINHHGQLDSNWSTSLSYSRLSDVDFLTDFAYNLTKGSKTSLKNSVVLSYQANNSNPLLDHFTGNVVSHQNLTDGTPPLDLLPSLTLSGGGYFGAASEVLPTTAGIHSTSWFYTLNYTNFQRNLTRLTGTDRIVGQRIHLQPTLQHHWISAAAFVKPSVSLPITRYWLDNQTNGYDSNPSRTLLQWQLDSGLSFERYIGTTLKQTLEPRLYYTYTPYQNQDQIPLFDTGNSVALYTTNRFSGSDRIADTNRVTLSVDSQLLTETGYQKAKLSLAQMHYLQDRRVQLSSTTAADTETSSPVYGQITYNFTPNLNGKLNIDWNSRTAEREQVSANMSYSDHSNQKINLTYSYKHDSSEQAELSFIWPIAPKWVLLVRHKADLLNQQTQENAMGLEFTNCCLNIRLVNRHWLVNADTGMQRGIFFQLELGNLGSTDTKLAGETHPLMAAFM